MWFRPGTTDTTQLIRAIWDFGKWLVVGPAIGGLAMLAFALLIGAVPDSLTNAMVWGAAFGLMAGVMVTGTRWMGRWKV